jgi:hypothetical protein
MSLANLFGDLSINSLITMYKRLSMPPEREQTEHPYEYIQRVYADSSPNSKLTGLAGFSPPFIVRLLNGITYYFYFVVIIGVLQFILTALVTITAFVTELISTIQFTVSIPYTGWVIVTVPFESSGDFIVIMTPLLLSFILFVVSTWIFTSLNKASHKLSEPYEIEYEAWLNDIKPADNGFPPGLAQSLSNTEFDYGDIPSSAPLKFRQIRRIEKIIYCIKTGYHFSLMLFFSMVLFQHRVMVDGVMIEEPIDGTTTIQDRRSDR